MSARWLIAAAWPGRGGARARVETRLKKARAGAAQAAGESLPEWERKHRARVENTLRAHGYLG